MELLIVVLVGACTGWLAGGLIKRGGLGALGDIAGGAIGGAAAAYIIPAWGLFDTGGLVGEALSAGVGAVLIVSILHLVIAD
jgi:uncharacterized membrane protein YeaQ/YmgE (transglycosylase-associated protein family)